MGEGARMADNPDLGMAVESLKTTKLFIDSLNKRVVTLSQA